MQQAPKAVDDDVLEVSQEKSLCHSTQQDVEGEPAIQFSGLPLWLSAACDVNTWSSFRLVKRPYYFLIRGDRPAQAISGMAGPAMATRPHDFIVRRVSSMAATHVSTRLGYWDPTFERVVKLNRWHDYASEKDDRAALNCLLQVQAYMPRSPTLDHCLNHAVASLCFEAGFLVKRDGDVAARLRDAIPYFMRHETLEATQRYLNNPDYNPELPEGPDNLKHRLLALQGRALSVEQFYSRGEDGQGISEVIVRPHLWLGYMAEKTFDILEWLMT